jgi:8-oxo-dGTP diphosphatase
LAQRKFPSGKYGKQNLVFHPAPFRAPLRAFAALVFCWQGDEVLLCNIEDRGWCIPSGRVEPFEDPLEAARREARELRWVDVFVSEIDDFCEIECPEESLGRQLVTMDELPGLYYQWSPLVEEVFHYSREVIDRLRERNCS